MPYKSTSGVFTAYILTAEARQEALAGAKVQRMVALLNEKDGESHREVFSPRNRAPITSNCFGLTVRWLVEIMQDPDGDPLARLQNILDSMPSACATQYMQFEISDYFRRVMNCPASVRGSLVDHRTLAMVPVLSDEYRGAVVAAYHHLVDQDMIATLNGATLGAGLRFSFVAPGREQPCPIEPPKFVEHLYGASGGLYIMPITFEDGSLHAVGIKRAGGDGVNRIFDLNLGEFEVGNRFWGGWFSHIQELYLNDTGKTVSHFHLLEVSKAEAGGRSAHADSFASRWSGDS